jgi:FtsZ-binding cell division protein ZapB
MQNTTLPDNTSPENSNTYSPSVPISLYREVTAELQAAQAMLDSLKTHNQQLVQQNQQLRREVETVVQVSQQLQQVVNSAQSVTQTGMPQMPSVKFNFSVEPEPRAPATSETNSALPQAPPAPQTVAFPFPLPEPEPTAPSMPQPLPEQLFTEVPEIPYRLRSKPKKASDLSGLWLAIAIFLIVIAAFGAGYLVVRPLLMKK